MSAASRFDVDDPYAEDKECCCDSGLPARFWTGDGWMCRECLDDWERELDHEERIRDER